MKFFFLFFLFLAIPIASAQFTTFGGESTLIDRAPECTAVVATVTANTSVIDDGEYYFPECTQLGTTLWLCQCTQGAFNLTLVTLPNTLNTYNVTVNTQVAGLLGDINRDGIVNVFDLLILLDNWGDVNRSDRFSVYADLTATGVVDVLDLLVLLAQWNQTTEKTLQQYIDEAEPFSTVVVPNRTYYESVIIDKPLTLVGSGATVIGSSTQRVVMQVTARNVTISDFSLWTVHDDKPALYAQNTQHVHLHNMSFHGTQASSLVYLQRVRSALIQDSVLADGALFLSMYANTSEATVRNVSVTSAPSYAFVIEHPFSSLTFTDNDDSGHGVLVQDPVASINNVSATNQFLDVLYADNLAVSLFILPWLQQQQQQQQQQSPEESSGGFFIPPDYYNVPADDTPDSIAAQVDDDVQETSEQQVAVTQEPVPVTQQEQIQAPGLGGLLVGNLPAIATVLVVLLVLAGILYYAVYRKD